MRASAVKTTATSGAAKTGPAKTASARTAAARRATAPQPTRAAPRKAATRAAAAVTPASALGEGFAGGEALLAREAAVLAKLEASLTDWWAWAKGRAGELAGDASALLRQRMADVLIEQLVATAVLAEARDHREEGGEERDRRGTIEAVALLRQRVRRCLQLAIEAIADSRGEAEAAGELAWMRRELSARRVQLAPRGEGVAS